MNRILIVDDEPGTCLSLARYLAYAGFSVKAATRAQEAIVVGRAFQPDVLISDWLLKDDLDGVDVAKALHGEIPNLRIILMTGFAAEQLEASLGGLAVEAIMEKPLHLDELVERLHAIGRQSRSPADAARHLNEHGT